MVQLEKILNLIHSSSWEQLANHFDELLSNESSADLSKNWLEDYVKQKLTIITQLNNKLNELGQNLDSSQSQQQRSNFEEYVIKLFAKGLILPELNRYEDLQLLNKIISSSENKKYLFMLYQQNLFEIKEIYQSHSFSILDKVVLKFLSTIPVFLKLSGKKIFEDIVQKFHEFYESYHKISNEENVIGEPDKELIEFLNVFNENTFNEFKDFIVSLDSQLTKNSIDKPTQKRLIFELFQLLYTNRAQKQKDIKDLVSQFIGKLSLTLQQFKDLPSFWITDHIKTFFQLYTHDYLFYIFGSILIKELPSRPEYSQIPNHLFELLKWVLQHLISRQQPIKSLSLKQNPLFMVQLFQRLSILVGLLNNSNENEKQINSMIKFLFNKKNLFQSPVLYEILWKQLINSHQDYNFRIFCLGHYKKFFLLPVKQICPILIKVLSSGSRLILKLVSQLQGNSNPEYIGFILTMVIYLFSFMKKLETISCSNPERQSKMIVSKSQITFKYLFSSQKMTKVKNVIHLKLQKIKESLKDRLQVLKMKTESQQQSAQKQKQANQLSICIYRIEEQIKFNQKTI